jgi:hypothetical protein
VPETQEFIINSPTLTASKWVSEQVPIIDNVQGTLNEKSGTDPSAAPQTTPSSSPNSSSPNQKTPKSSSITDPTHSSFKFAT